MFIVKFLFKREEYLLLGGFMMIKKIGFIMILMIAAIFISWFVIGKSMEKSQELSDAPSIQSPNNDEITRPKNSKEFIEEIFTLAMLGKVPQISFVAGETKIQDVYKKWGEPDNTTQAVKGHYDSYKENVIFGYQDNLIFDIRSSYPELQQIHLNKIKEMKGEPDDVEYYKDETQDQKILVYKVSENYQLKWTFSNIGENPAVHHISVFTTVDSVE